MKFAIESRENGNKFEGEYISLENSLDFANDKSYVDPTTTILAILMKMEQ